MYLQLAEGYTPPGMYYMSERRKGRHVAGDTYVSGYTRRGNRVPGHWRSLSEEAGVEDNPYVFIPDFTGQSSGFMVREDNLDDLTQQEWNALMVEVAPYQPQVQQGMSEGMFLADRAARKKKREDKQATKQAKKDAKTAIKNARAEKIKAGGGGKGSGLLNSISGALGGILGGALGITPAQAQTPGDANTGSTTGTSFWDQTALFNTPNKIVIPVAIAATGLGIWGYRTYRKRKRK